MKDNTASKIHKESLKDKVLPPPPTHPLNVQWTSIPWVRRSLRLQQHAKASHLEEIKGPETSEAINIHTGISQGEISVRETVQKNYNLHCFL